MLVILRAESAAFAQGLFFFLSASPLGLASRLFIRNKNLSCSHLVEFCFSPSIRLNSLPPCCSCMHSIPGQRGAPSASSARRLALGPCAGPGNREAPNAEQRLAARGNAEQCHALELLLLSIKNQSWRHAADEAAQGPRPHEPHSLHDAAPPDPASTKSARCLRRSPRGPTASLAAPPSESQRAPEGHRPAAGQDDAVDKWRPNCVQR